MSTICQSLQPLWLIPRYRRKQLLLFFVGFTLCYFVVRTNVGMVKEARTMFAEIITSPVYTNSTVKFGDDANGTVHQTTTKETRTDLTKFTSPLTYLTHDTSYSTEMLTNDSYSLCPETPPGLVGKIKIPSHESFHTENLTKIMQEIENENNDLTFGGLWYPKGCQSIQNIALIIPYRNRSEHLAILLKQLNMILKRQLTYYQIFVVEQYGNSEFNKARIMNIAFKYINSSSNSNFNCFIFHDVDLIPENDKNLYRCDDDSPRHLSPAVSSLRYRLPYEALIGGVLAITPDLYERVNGYSNLYWGWGGEDDDMYYRMQAENIVVNRPSLTIGRYTMISHSQRIGKPERMALVWSAKERYKKDGYAQLHTLNYTIKSVTKYFLYTHIMVDIGLPPTSLQSTSLPPTSS